MFRGTVANMPPLSKGLFDSLNNIDLEPGYTPDTRNSRFGPNYCRKRLGSTSLGTGLPSSTRFTGGFQYRNTSGNLVDSVTMRDGKFYVNIGGTWTDRTGAITLATVADTRVHSIAYNGSQCGTDNVNTPFTWSGDTASNAAVLGGSPPQRCLLFGNFGDRLIAVNFTSNTGTAYPDGIAWSGINVTTGWTTTTTGFLRVQQQGGNSIYGVGYDGDRMVLLFERTIHEVILTGYAVTPFEVAQVTAGCGTRAPYAVVNVFDDVFFLAEYGPERLSMVKSGQKRQLSERIRNFWSTVDWTDATTFSGCYAEDEGVIKWGVRVGSATENTKTIIYHPELDTFSIDDTYVADVSWAYTTSAGVGSSACGSTDRVMQLNTGTTDMDASAGTTAAISWYAYTMWFDMSNAGSNGMRRKLWNELQLQFLQGAQSTLTVGYQISLFPDLRTAATMLLLNRDNAGIWDSGLYDDAVWAGSADDQGQGRAPLEGDSTHIRFKFSNAESTTVAIEGYSVAFRDTTGL